MTIASPPASAQAGRYASFDVFDTLVTRAVGNPNDLFLLLGQRLLRAGAIKVSAEIFARQRVAAERRANHRLDRHCTLDEIARELARSLGLRGGGADVLARAEEEIERQLLSALPGAAWLVEQARAGGMQVVYVTDTYFSSGFIKALLTTHGFWHAGDTVFASCEAQVDKGRGLMFPHVRQAFNAHRTQFTHHGNDDVADVRNGKMSGWNVKHLPQGNLNRYERALAAQAFATGGYSSLLAGASRMARLRVVEALATSTSPRASVSDREQVLVKGAAGVMAPLLTAWMVWTMQTALRDGCRRIYFLSRDGEVLLDVAQRLELLLRTGLELRYIYGSRQSLQLCAGAEAALRDLLRLESCRWQDVLDLLQVDAAALQAWLPSAPSIAGRLGNGMSAAERKALLALLSEPGFAALVEQRAAAVRSMVADYYQQEGWNDGVPFALVDVGWRGSTVGALAKAFGGSATGLPSKYYFFGLGNDAHRVAGAASVETLDAWFFDDSSIHGYLPYLASTTTLIEMFCAGGHGAVRGFERSGAGAGRVVPILRSPTSPMHDWGLPLLRHTTAAFVDAFVAAVRAVPDTVDLAVDTREPIRTVTELFWLEPTAEEVRHWGSYPVEVNLTNSVVLPLAERVGFQQVWSALKSRRFSFRSEHSWPHGTALASPQPYRYLLITSFKLKQKPPQWRRRLRWLGDRFRR